jgi:tetratricopeptide (TPR) repeat protein
MSEFPYLACMFAILIFLGREGERPRRRGIMLVAPLLAFLPFIRTIGLVWIAAIGLWGLCSRARWRWALVAAISLLPTLLWSWRNSGVEGPTYLAAIFREISDSTSSELLHGYGSGALYYLRAFIDLLLPAVAPGRPLYERVLLTPAPDLGGLFGLTTLLAPAFALLFLLGLYTRRREEGSLIALQTLLLFAALAIYPPRHERLIWPLLPLAWIYALAGAATVGEWLVRRLPRSLAPARGLAIIAVVAVIVWQGIASAGMTAANLSWLRMGDRFYDELVPPVYYADWQGAGNWLAAHSAAEARVLTRHSDVGFTSRRYQDSLRFEELPPMVWRRHIMEFKARYLVVPTTLCSRLFPFHLLESDPVYRYEKVYEKGDVAVLEIVPNRSGTVELQPLPDAVTLQRCHALAGLHPGRIDLIRRNAELLGLAGRPAEAERSLRDAIEGGLTDARLGFSLSRVLEQQGRDREALEELIRATSKPNAFLLKKRMGRAIERLRSTLDEREPEALRLRRLFESFHWNMNRLEYGRARDDLARLLELAPGTPEVLLMQGDLMRAAGREAEAKEAYRKAALAGQPRATEILRTMRLEGAARTEEEYLRLSSRLAGEVFPGKALAQLERARGLHPDSRRIRLGLADLYLTYGLVRESQTLYRDLLNADPRDEAAFRGLQACRQAGRIPSF